MGAAISTAYNTLPTLYRNDPRSSSGFRFMASHKGPPGMDNVQKTVRNIETLSANSLLCRRSGIQHSCESGGGSCSLSLSSEEVANLALLNIPGIPRVAGDLIQLTYHQGVELLESVQTRLASKSEPVTDPRLLRPALRVLHSLAPQLDRYPENLMLHEVQIESSIPVYDGQHADVFAGHLSPSKQVAVKRFRLSGTPDQTFGLFKALLTESLVWVHVHHSNVLPFLGLWSDCVLESGRLEISLLCMVTPWMRHGNLRTFLNKATYITDQERQQLVLGVARGLAYLHSSGIVHGDLRGVNILVDENMCPLLADYGLAQLIAEWPMLATRKKPEGSTRWTSPELLSPESFGLTNSNPTCASDMYAFACVCYEIYTSRAPFFTIKRDAAVIFRVMNGERPAYTIQNIPYGLPPANIEGLITKCWDQLPEKRPSAAQVVECLQKAPLLSVT
ncbi:kinase-like protein [Punctularia strigosozonata HHB-11173 SS5]|uniref:Kinase-like protein n=1 Tax=Punctularia strigosozonata (strain HHB-11173) TaxID=741275 RepID=R7S429_PUNST|nr:kinase-like protein [Punctularia strigosozonata HHB-11173 SS5]EIN04609.1 kinase-like protein [Punctularia strigosozonata HHB-11173 SS5]